MVPYDHAILSVRDFGGKVEDYLPLHKFIDSTKFHCTDFRHRAILHSTFGIGLCEDKFGDVLSNGVPVREVARRHIMQDCGCIPTLKEWLDALSNGEPHKYNNPMQSDLEYLKEYEKGLEPTTNNTPSINTSNHQELAALVKPILDDFYKSFDSNKVTIGNYDGGNDSGQFRIYSELEELLEISDISLDEFKEYLGELSGYYSWGGCFEASGEIHYNGTEIIFDGWETVHEERTIKNVFYQPKE